VPGFVDNAGAMLTFPRITVPDHDPPFRFRSMSRLALAWGCGWALVALVSGCDTKNVIPPNTGRADTLVISPHVDTLAIGEAKGFASTARDSAGVVIAASISWVSRDPSILRSDGGGRVTGMSEGTTYLVATADSARDSALVTVIAPQAGWFLQTSVGANLNGVFFLPDGRHGWTVGDAGKIALTTNAGTNWTIYPSNTARDLHAVSFTGPDTGWAVGDAGTVLESVDGGRSWTLVIVSASENLRDVFFADSRHGWIVGGGGGNGVILHTIDGGKTWGAVRPTIYTLNSVAFADTANGWAVGNFGTIFSATNGSNWSLVTSSPVTTPLNGVSALSATFAVAVGTQGSASGGTSGWTFHSAGTSGLDGVHFPLPLIGFAVGASGAIQRSDDGGDHWTQQASHTQYHLRDVYFTDVNRGWAVGDGGTVMHTGTGGRP
jgi:photosystem II stability/assembly factor-like uncharacterized protein